MRAVAVPGRWVWGLSGLVTAAAIALPGARLIVRAGMPDQPPPQDVVTRTVTVPQPVTSLTLDTYGGQVSVAAGPVSRVQITETIMYDPKGGLPGVAESVSGGRLSLGDPACATMDCLINFALTVPSDLTATVATQGDSVTVSGIAGANLDSDGGPVRATQIGGPLTVSTNGGPLLVSGVAGALHADTGGGTLVARGVGAKTATVTSGGGPAMIAFTTAPDTVTVSTDGGTALLNVPGGPYALTAESDGGPQVVGIATNPAARASITVTSGGGLLQIEPASSASGPVAGAVSPGAGKPGKPGAPSPPSLPPKP